MLVSVLCNPRCTHTSTHSYKKRANSWWWQWLQCKSTHRRKATMSCRGAEALFLLWMPLKPKPELSFFTPWDLVAILLLVKNIWWSKQWEWCYTIIKKKNTVFIGRTTSSWWKSPWKGKHPISLSYVWISWLLKNVGLQSVLCQWPFSLEQSLSLLCAVAPLPIRLSCLHPPAKAPNPSAERHWLWKNKWLLIKFHFLLVSILKKGHNAELLPSLRVPN